MYEVNLKMTSFRNIVIITNLATVGLGVVLIVVSPENAIVHVIGKMLVIAGIFANVYLALTLSGGPIGRRSM